jgi:hypothetical protein
MLQNKEGRGSQIEKRNRELNNSWPVVMTAPDHLAAATRFVCTNNSKRTVTAVSAALSKLNRNKEIFILSVFVLPGKEH